MLRCRQLLRSVICSAGCGAAGDPVEAVPILGVNRVVLVGYLGVAPRYNTNNAGDDTCLLMVGTEQEKRSREGVPATRTDWHRVIVWGRMVVLCRRYLQRGSELCVEGTLTNREWRAGGMGPIRRTTEVRAAHITFLGRPGESTTLHTAGAADQLRCDEFAGPEAHKPVPLQAPPV